MSANPTSLTWKGLREAPLTLEEKARIETEKMLDAKYSDPSALQEDAKWVCRDLYGWLSPEISAEEKEDNEVLFETRYRSDFAQLGFSQESIEAIQSIFIKNGDIETAIYQNLPEHVSDEQQKENLAEKIARYLDPKVTSDRVLWALQWENGIRIVEGMNLSSINALTWSRHNLSFSSNADSLRIWDTISVPEWSDDIFVNWEDVGDVEKGYEDIPERIGTDFSESSYYPLIEQRYSASTGKGAEHDITGEQFEAIWESYQSWTPLLNAVKEILWDNHEITGKIEELENPSTLSERQAQMKEDQNLWENCEINPETGFFTNSITQLISENYVRFADAEWNVDAEQSLRTAIHISANKIIEGKHTFKRTEEFEKAYERIKDPDTSKEQLWNDLTLIFNTVNDAEGIRGKAGQDRAYRARKLAEQKSLYLQESFYAIQDSMRKPETESLQDSSSEDAWQTKDETPSSWDIFEAWALDAWWEASETTQKSA